MFRDARPLGMAEQVVRLTCLTHGLVASSDEAVTQGTVSMLMLELQARERLAALHGRQGV